MKLVSNPMVRVIEQFKSILSSYVNTITPCAINKNGEDVEVAEVFEIASTHLYMVRDIHLRMLIVDVYRCATVRVFYSSDGLGLFVNLYEQPEEKIKRDYALNYIVEPFNRMEKSIPTYRFVNIDDPKFGEDTKGIMGMAI